MSDPVELPEEGGPGDTLDPSESLDSEEVRNDDGDVVVDSPEGWSVADRFGVSAEEQRQGESPEARLAQEEPDVIPDVEPAGERSGRADRGQISGTPEDGESLYDVVD